MEEPLVPIVFVSMKNGSDAVTLKALLDSGVGNFHTARIVNAAFQLTELNPTAKIDYKLHVVNSLGVYNMILSRDFVKSQGVILNHTMETIMWDDASIPMKTMSM
eukprot:14733209-Ditylum_brightwellii.AAC.1